MLEKYIKKSHGQDLKNKKRLFRYGYYFSKYYSIVMAVLFVVFCVIVTMMSFDHDVSEYCIHVPTSEPHHFSVGDNNACLIDWMFFIKQLFFIVLIIYVPLILPINLLYLFLKHRLKKK